MFFLLIQTNLCFALIYPTVARLAEMPVNKGFKKVKLMTAKTFSHVQSGNYLTFCLHRIKYELVLFLVCKISSVIM